MYVKRGLDHGSLYFLLCFISTDLPDDSTANYKHRVLDLSFLPWLDCLGFLSANLPWSQLIAVYDGAL
jgi:hypothetical protein